jgi:hypothetical protein
VSQEEEEILVNRIGGVGWRSGRLGGGLWGASGGRLGARLAARLRPHDVHEILLVLALPPDEALALASSLRSANRPMRLGSPTRSTSCALSSELEC